MCPKLTIKTLKRRQWPGDVTLREKKSDGF